MPPSTICRRNVALAPQRGQGERIPRQRLPRRDPRAEKDQWPGQSILPNYEKRIAEIEQIIRRSTWSRCRSVHGDQAGQRSGSAAVPAPNMRPPRLIGNNPASRRIRVAVPHPGGPAGSKTALQFDDFTYDAAAWTLVAHEGRPGHELQFVP